MTSSSPEARDLDETAASGPTATTVSSSSTAAGAATEAGAVLTVLDTLDAVGCRVWLAGGWAVDALVGRQTRPHRDLDLAVDHAGLARAVAALTALGYVVETDWLPVRVELHRPAHGRVDLHPVVFDAWGDGVQVGLDGAEFRYPRQDFVRGSIEGTEVGCLSRELQLTFRQGYELRDVDHHDLALLEALPAHAPLLRPLVLTGGPAVGKSATAALLARSRPRAAVIDVDDVRQLVVSGGAAPWEGDEGRAQQRLGVENACGLAARFLEGGVEVVIADVLVPDTLELYRTLLPDVLVVRLHVTPAEAWRRAGTRVVHLTDDEFRSLHDQDGRDPPAAAHHLEVSDLTLDEQAAVVTALWHDGR